MAKPDIRIDRVIRATIWNHQTVTMLIQDQRLYVIRTGVLGAAATGSVMNEASMIAAGHLFGGDGRNPFSDLAVGQAAESISLWTARKAEGVLTGMAGGVAELQEARIDVEPPERLATGWMSANVALSDITAAAVSETHTDRVKGLVPQLKIKAGKVTITLRFPRTPLAVAQGLADYLQR